MLKHLVALLAMTGAAFATPVHLRCEYLQNPLGLDAATPQLSWQSDSTEHNWRQSAYQISVASDPAHLRDGKPDVWNSGKDYSSDSVGILYGGPKLESGHRYYWSVKVWDVNGQTSESSEPAFWEMGLLDRAAWKGKWIAWKNPEAEADRSGMKWVWVPGSDPMQQAPGTTAIFRVTAKLSGKPDRAALFVIARGDFKVKVNGHEVSSKTRWTSFDRQEVGDLLMAGDNAIEVAVTVPRGEDDSTAKPKQAGMAALLKVMTGSQTQRFATGKGWETKLEKDSDWKKAAAFADLNDPKMGAVPSVLPEPAALFRKSFSVSKQVASARLFATALGAYRLYLNGTPVGNDVLMPGFTDYRKRVLYQTYDVTSSIASGANAISAMLGDGWYSSSLTWTGVHLFPPPNRLIAQLEINYTDGSHETVVTDGSWKSAQSPILHSEIYAGEVYDARLERSGWGQAAFDDAKWARAVVAEAPSAMISSQIDVPVHIRETLEPKSITPGANGTYVVDMGQNMVGWVKLKVNGPAGTAVHLRFAEILSPDGSIYRDNLRDADAADTYILRGGGDENFEPYFTFHGFRYVEVSGFPGQPATANLTGEVVSSIVGDPTGTLETSSTLVNRMWSIGLWGQRGNYLSIPTDCPQRDERLGWMGDAGVFWRTGTYNYDISAFSQKFMNDVVDAQTPEGAFTNVAPDVLGGDATIGAPGWGDAGVIVPYTTWLQYGNRQIIVQHWDAMQHWMEFLQKANPDFLRKNGVGPNFADWLAPDQNTDKTLLATAYWALIADQMREMAKAVGKEDDARRYAELIQNIRTAFQKAYIKDDGVVGTGTQTSYVVALYTQMAPEALEPALVDHLVKDIEAHQWHLSTGFLGTPFLLFTLSDHGRNDVAYRLLLNETYPSWGYMLSKGATTWWERWNGDTGDPSMNSYNHYAFGSVIAWVYRYAAGIDTVPTAPGFKEIVVRPHLDPQMSSSHGEYDSIYGKITSDWKLNGTGDFALHLSIPANTTAKVFLPVIANKHAMQDGQAVSAEGRNGFQQVQVGSGSYDFEIK